MGKKQNANKQDKKLKKEKKAKAEADKIIADAITKVKERPKTKYDDERKEGISDEAWVLGARVRELREQGEPWWSIARDLELEGFGQSATTGKKGAARASAAYKTAFGDFPRTFKRGGYKGPIERNEHVRELKKMKKAEAKAIAKSGKSVIDMDMPPEDIAAMLKGRRIKWFSTELVPEGIDYEACVHPTAPMYIFEENGTMVVEFREQHRRAPMDIRWHPAQKRTVRLRQIYSVK